MQINTTIILKIALKTGHTYQLVAVNIIIQWSRFESE